jgi:hypothetical protein
LFVFYRERFAPGPVIQKAYGILDKFKISRTYFITTDQKDCVTLPPAVEAVDEPLVQLNSTLEATTVDYDDIGDDVIEVKDPEKKKKNTSTPIIKLETVPDKKEKIKKET